MKVNPYLFFRFHEDKLIVWNYRAHEQFELTLPYFRRLYELGAASSQIDAAEPASPAQIDRELADANLVAPGYPGSTWGWDSLSHIFHFGTSSSVPTGAALPREDGSAAYIEQCEAIDDSPPAVIPELTGERFALPPPDVTALEQRSLWDALVARRTTREFTGEPIELAVVGNILYATFGAVHGPERGDVDGYGIRSYGYRRTSPSGGGLQTTEPYLVNFTIAGLPTGIYHYHSIDHRLTRIEGDFPAGDLGPLLAGQNFANDLGFAIFMVARFDKMWWKYPHSRSYRVALMDIGHLSQTFHLACTGYGLTSWLTAAFYDDEIARRLRIDPASQAVMLVVGAGTGNGRAINQAILDALRTR